ncbi:anti-sigma factor [Streptomyces sp. NBC_00083]|uniref:anti-sigma factor n=1 Tax=Streptomyces sp. NBC_00083 TaxID=2975647 RepID=UPI0022506B07|nr:anti-sigma factor [Streptomyces sp. NBC_00083]MCX5387261.1 anti-sigma factor [Streptomyces sp. NBC_00083]
MIGADLHTLTGAYAVHALLDDEREEFERHLAACESCTREVHELTATAGRLGLAMTATPPAALKADVLRRISTVRQDAPRTGPLAPSTSRTGRGRALSRFVLAACLAAAVGLGGVAVWQHQQADSARDRASSAQQQYRQLTDVLAAPDAKATTGHVTGGANGTLVIARSRNQAVFLASGLAQPPAGKVYQLWFDDAGTMRSAGLMDPARTTEAVLLTGPVDQASGMGITLEPAGGSPHPTTQPLAVMAFPQA